MSKNGFWESIHAFQERDHLRLLQGWARWREMGDKDSWSDTRGSLWGWCSEWTTHYPGCCPLILTTCLLKLILASFLVYLGLVWILPQEHTCQNCFHNCDGREWERRHLSSFDTGRSQAWLFHPPYSSSLPNGNFSCSSPTVPFPEEQPEQLTENLSHYLFFSSKLYSGPSRLHFVCLLHLWCHISTL